MTERAQARVRRELSGWKGIAGHLDVSVRTAQNWAQDRGLPVRRRAGRVYADLAEIEEWLRREGRPVVPPTAGRPRRRPGRIFLLGAGALLAASALAVISLFTAPKPLLAAAVRHDQLVGLGPDGQALWRIDLPPVGNNAGRRPFLRDVDGDGRPEVFLNVHPPPDSTQPGRLLSVDSAGKLRWIRRYGRRIEVGRRVFELFHDHHTRWVETGDRLYLLVVAGHVSWYPSQVLLLDPRSGEVVSEYWHPGYAPALVVADVDGEGGPPEILLGGSNNPGEGGGRPFLAVLDVPFTPLAPDEPPGFFPHVTTRPRKYLLFPVPEALREHSFVSLRQIRVLPDGRIEVLVGSPGETLFYYLDRDFTIDDVRPSDALRILTARLAPRGPAAEADSWRDVLALRVAPDGNDPGSWPDAAP